MTELDITRGKWCEQCYAYHIEIGDLIASLAEQGYTITIERDT